MHMIIVLVRAIIKIGPMKLCSNAVCRKKPLPRDLDAEITYFGIINITIFYEDH